MKSVLILLSATFLIAYCQKSNEPTDTASKKETTGKSAQRDTTEQLSGREDSISELLESIKAELPPTIEFILQNREVRQAQCRRNGTSFYDPINKICRPCEKYCHQNDYCGLQCEGYFLRKEFDEERRLTKEKHAKIETTLWLAVAVTVTILFALFVYTCQTVRRLKGKRNGLNNIQPSQDPKGAYYNNDTSKSSSTISGESVCDIDEENANLCEASSQNQQQQYDLTITQSNQHQM